MSISINVKLNWIKIALLAHVVEEAVGAGHRVEVVLVLGQHLSLLRGRHELEQLLAHVLRQLLAVVHRQDSLWNQDRRSYRCGACLQLWRRRTEPKAKRLASRDIQKARSNAATYFVS